MKVVPSIGIVVLTIASALCSSAQDLSPRAPSAVVPTSDNVLLKGGAFTASPLIDTIGKVEVGSTHSDSVTVTNTATTTLTITSVTSSNARFTVAPTTATIVAGANRKFRVTFAPTATGAQSTLIIFVHSATTSPDTVKALGTGIAPTFTVDRRTLAYGFVPIATTKADSVVVSNGGDAPLIISSVTSSNASFVVTPAADTLQPGIAGTFRITFTPAVSGLQTGNVVFVHNGVRTRDTVTVRGSGTAFTVNPKSLAFGSVLIGRSGTDSVSVANSGSTALTISNVASTNGRFSVNPTTVSIPATTKKTFVVTFTPSDTTLESGTLIFTHSSSSSPDTVVLSGTGKATQPKFSVNRRSILFDTVVVGQTGTDSVIVTNTGTNALLISSAHASTGAFSVSPPTDSLPPGRSATFTITFAPQSGTPVSGSVLFTHNAPGSPDTVRVSGIGAAPKFSLNRVAAAFGVVPVGATKVDSVIVTNTGNATLVIDSVVSTVAPFTVIPANATLPSSQSRTFIITFAPVDTTHLSGSLVFTHSATGSPDTVTVSGAGALPGFTLDRRNAAFGFVRVGTGKLDSVLVTNTGTAPLLISNVVSSSGLFTVRPANATIQASHSQSFVITFTPTDTTSKTGSIVFTHNAPGAHDTVTVSGAGTLASFSPNRTTIAFGYVTIGGQRVDSVIIANTGLSPLQITGVSWADNMFTVQPGAVTLQPGATQTYRITFIPTNTTPRTAHIIFAYNAPGSPDTITVTGTGTVAVFTIDRRTVAFGEVPVGGTARDSVTVTNSGASTLLITNVSSSKGVFSVNPTTASIAAGGHATFTIAFAPTNATAQSGFIVFTHIALSSPDTVRVSGVGSQAGISFNKRSIAFGYVVLGGSKVDSSIVTNTGTTPLTISSVVSDNSIFAVSPGNAVIQPGTTRTFSITCTPKDTSAQSGFIVFTHTALGHHDTISVSGTGLVPLSPPVPLSPSNGAVGLALPLVMSWSAVSGATGYAFEMATDSLFTMVVMSAPAVTAPGLQVNGLPNNTRLYWHVSTRTVAGSGPWSQTWTLTTLSSAFLSGSVTFSGELNSDSYKMFGMPGIGTRTVGSILPGSRNVDWRMLRETGMDTTYPAYYQDLTADSIVRAGEGYWLLSKKTLTISRTDTLPPLAQDGTFAIPVHQGWNIITNPFTANVLRSAVIAANGLPGGTLFWEHDGSTTTSSGTTLDPFKGYYFFNDSTNVATLKFPYPFTTNLAKQAGPSGYAWRVELVFDGDHSSDRDNYFGIAPAATPGLNALDQREPPLFFDKGFLYFTHPEWDARYPRFATDIRPEIGSGQTWSFEVWNPRGGAGKISFLGVEAIPENLDVVLINAQNSAPVDIRRTPVYAYQTLSPRTDFSLLIGTEEFVHKEISSRAPQECALEQNYPNPFNPKTVISGQWTVDSKVTLVVYDVLGREVAVLANGRYPAGKYAFTFDGSRFASGMYYYRLSVGQFSAVRQMVLVK